MNPEVEDLLERSRVLGSDKTVTNFGGGNTSIKTKGRDPVAAESIQLLWIKGSGGDLGTLTRDGLAVLDLDRLIALKDVYSGPDHEDEMVTLLEHCRFGPGGAAPSIDTSLHALLPPRHVDHVHPDAVIALAAAEDGEALVKDCFGNEVAWVPWRRPGFELAMQMEVVYLQNPALRGIVLGGHGLFSWGETSDECRDNTLALVRQAGAFLSEKGRPVPFGALVSDRLPLEEGMRQARAAELAPAIRGLCSTDKRVVARFTDDPVVLDFMARERFFPLAQMGTCSPDHFLRTKIRPLVVDQTSKLESLHARYRAEYQAYYRRHATSDSPAIRGSDPAIVLVPGIGMWSFGTDAHDARVAGEFYVNAINVMRGAESVSSYQPIDEAEKFAIEYWALEEAKLRRRPPQLPLTGRVALVTGAGSGIGRAIAQRLVAEGAAVVIGDINTEAAGLVADELGAVAIQTDVSDEASVAELLRQTCLAYGGLDIIVNNAGIAFSAPVTETSVQDWDRQNDVIARGSFLISRAAARVLVEQGLGGDIVYVVSKNAVFASPNAVAYGAAKANQAHQVRLLAVELGEHGIRVNGVNPDAVVTNSGIFEGDWGDQRAAQHGVPREDLARFYAERTLLKREVMPEHVASAVFALVGGELPVTTGTIIPVDAGVPGGFLR